VDHRKTQQVRAHRGWHIASPASIVNDRVVLAEHDRRRSGRSGSGSGPCNLAFMMWSTRGETGMAGDALVQT
jgi:hypothetical protein